jgi:hypothetical protein
MGKLVVELPDSLREKASNLAKRNGLSLEEFVAQAIAARIAAAEMSTQLAERTRRGNRADFDAVLAKVPDTLPEEEDRL